VKTEDIHSTQPIYLSRSQASISFSRFNTHEYRRILATAFSFIF
jgi:hypothetical protein